MKKTFSILILLFSALTLPGFAGTAQANIALQHGRVAEAEAALRTSLAVAPRDAYAHQLLCRVYYAQDEVRLAVPECEAAVAAAPDDSDSQLWLGRAYGKKAEHANSLVAFTLARKVRAAFERAVQVKPTNVAAMSDLGEFYVAAPAIVGGGLDKASRLAASMQAQSPAKAHRLLAYIANSRKDAATAEAEFKNAVAAGRTPDAYVDLGMFYQDHGQPDRAIAALKTAIEVDTARDGALVDAATILLETGRAPDLAVGAMRAYLGSAAQSDGAPVFKVHLQLGKLLAKQGDMTGAKREYDAAYALAPGFQPARDAVRGA